MENLIELATYEDEEYGTITQFLDSDNNCIFYKEKISETGHKIYEKVDQQINDILEEKYFSMESDVYE